MGLLAAPSLATTPDHEGAADQVVLANVRHTLEVTLNSHIEQCVYSPILKPIQCVFVLWLVQPYCVGPIDGSLSVTFRLRNTKSVKLKIRVKHQTPYP